jgi:hypothetical protein
MPFLYCFNPGEWIEIISTSKGMKGENEMCMTKNKMQNSIHTAKQDCCDCIHCEIENVPNKNQNVLEEKARCKKGQLNSQGVAPAMCPVFEKRP